MPACIVLAISQRYQIRIARQFLIDRIFKPGLLFSLSTWTRPTSDHSEVKIGLYLKAYKQNFVKNAFMVSEKSMF